MKKVLAVAVALLFCATSFAQLRTSRTFVNEKKKSNIEWILRGGVSIGEDKTGPDISFGFNKAFSKSNLYWGAELGVGSRGVESLEISAKFFPQIGYKFKCSDRVRLDLHVGPYIAYDVACDCYDPCDVGVQAGVGVWFGRFNIDLMYQSGFIEATYAYSVREYSDYIGMWTTDWHYYDSKTSNIIVRIGYCF